jgi:PAS domain S-box-containing protein
MGNKVRYKDNSKNQLISDLICPYQRVVESDGVKACSQSANKSFQERTERYFNIFRYSPVSLWEKDFSEIKLYFDRLKSRGIKDFRKYFEKHPEEVISLAGKVKVVEVNEATLKLYQARSLEEFHQGLKLLFNKKSYDVFREELIALSEGKTEFFSKAVTLTFKGEERHILLKSAVAPGYEETLSKVLVSITDISDFKQMEKDMQESVEKYRKIFETANEAIFLADTETGIILEANKKAEELLGVSTDTIVGMHYTQLHPKEEADRYRNIFQDHVDQGKLVSENIVMSQKSGAKIPVSISSSVIELKGKKLISGVFREMTQKKLEIVNKYKSNDLRTTSSPEKLTEREREILLLIASGFTNRQMSEKLCISGKTVVTHRTRIMQKLDVHKTAGLVRYAIVSGLLE